MCVCVHVGVIYVCACWGDMCVHVCVHVGMVGDVYTHSIPLMSLSPASKRSLALILLVTLLFSGSMTIHSTGKLQY